ncbi:MAG: ROK family protein [Rhodospirillaceae bacterium]|nr:ROK family protein [Rhodospirillaceae bacterium]
MSETPNRSQPLTARIGVDLGGTKIEAIVLDRSGEVRARRRVATPRESYGAIVAAIADLVATCEADAGIAGLATPVGVGIPGTISPATGLIKNANTVVLIGHALDRDLTTALGRPVRLGNDADCFALSEASDGAAAGAEIVFGVILGTGTGGGLVVAGRLVKGPNAISGEWGHNPLPWPRGTADATHNEVPGARCYCGKDGCIETFLSGPGLERQYAAATGQPATAAEIATRDEAGEPAARTAMDLYCDRLARSLATVINIVDPHMVVLGGGLSKIDRLYRDVPALLPRYVFSDTVVTRVVAPRHGDSSGVRGAAWLWP